MRTICLESKCDPTLIEGLLRHKNKSRFARLCNQEQIMTIRAGSARLTYSTLAVRHFVDDGRCPNRSFGRKPVRRDLCFRGLGTRAASPVQSAIPPLAAAPAAPLSAPAMRVTISHRLGRLLISARAMMLVWSGQKTVQLGNVRREDGCNQLE